MLSLFIAISCGIFSSFLASTKMESLGWPITIGIVSFLVVAIILNRHFGKKLTSVVNRVQEMLTESQNDAFKMINRFQSKPVGSQKIMEKNVEKKVEVGVIQALEVLDTIQPLFKWSLLAERQINTLKMQLNFQIKRFDEADKLMPGIFVLEPLTLCMKMVRQYHNNSPELDKTYKKGIKKFKYEKGILVHSLYAWILVKRKDVDRALEVLTNAKEKIDDEIIQRNWQNVANNKIHLFSNAGLGEQWYALHLDKPPKQRTGKGQMKGNPMAPKGKRRFF